MMLKLAGEGISPQEGLCFCNKGEESAFLASILSGDELSSSELTCDDSAEFVEGVFEVDDRGDDVIGNAPSNSDNCMLWDCGCCSKEEEEEEEEVGTEVEVDWGKEVLTGVTGAVDDCDCNCASWSKAGDWLLLSLLPSSDILGKGVKEIECLGDESALAEIPLLALLAAAAADDDEESEPLEEDRGGATSPKSPAVDEGGEVKPPLPLPPG
jgi:hypothetical protein